MLQLLRTTVETPRSCSFPMAVNASSSVVTGCLVNKLQQKKKTQISFRIKWKIAQVKCRFTDILGCNKSTYLWNWFCQNKISDWLVGCLTWSSATITISRTGSKTCVWQFYILPHRDKAERRWLLSQPVTVYRHRRNHKRANGAGIEPTTWPGVVPYWLSYLQNYSSCIRKEKSMHSIYMLMFENILYFLAMTYEKSPLISYAIVPKIHHIVL